MRELINSILEKYPHARSSTAFGGQHEIRSLFESLKSEIESIEFLRTHPDLIVKYSYGKGNWAETPWLAILNKTETTTTQQGVYVVFSFDKDGKWCRQMLGQGVTQIRELYGTESAQELQHRADKIRSLFPEMKSSSYEPELLSDNQKNNSLGSLYEASTIYAKKYFLNQIPSDKEILEDIRVLMNCYDKYMQNRDGLFGKTEEADDLDESRKIWAISLGEGGRLWNECYEQGIISIGWDQLGDLSKYESQKDISKALLNENASRTLPLNDSLCCYQFVHEMNPGDWVVAKIGRKKVLGGGIVISGYTFDETRREFKNTRKVRWLTKEKAEFPSGGVATKTLTEISRYTDLREFAESYMPESTEMNQVLSPPYLYNDALKDLFINRVELETIINTAKRKKNIILQGPPGVGKTFISKRLAYLIMKEKDPSRIEFIQFHQSYSYEDFVQGWRPNSEGGFILKNGSFYSFCEKASLDPSRPYVFIIDEINRGNLSKVFGELLMLIEFDKRGSQNAIKLTYSESEAEKFSVPSNVYLIGLMNTADRSLALVDYALRRRFAFFNLSPQFKSEQFEESIISNGGSKKLTERIRQNIGELNGLIVNQKRDLGSGFQIGHSYFCPTESIVSEDNWYLSIIENEIKPLVVEYWFDDIEKVEAIVKGLRK